MATISKTGINDGQVIYAEHITRVIDALNGEAQNDIIISGSVSISGSLNATASHADFATSASWAGNAYWTASGGEIHRIGNVGISGSFSVHSFGNNIISNGTFDTDVNGWNALEYAEVTHESESIGGRTNVLKFYKSGSIGNYGSMNFTLTPMDPKENSVLRIRYDLYITGSNTTTKSIRIRPSEYVTQIPNDIIDSWVHFDMLHTRTTSAQAYLRIYTAKNDGNLGGDENDVFYLDNFSIEEVSNFYVSGTITHFTNDLEIEGSTKFGDSAADTHQFTGSLAVSGSIKIIDGSAAVPSLRFNSNPETGMYFLPDGSYGFLGIVINDVETFRIGMRANGWQGILLNGGGSDTHPPFSFVDDDDTGFYAPSANELGFATSGSEKVRIDSNGNVGIGTTDPDQKLHIEDSANTFALVESTGNNSGLLLTRPNNTKGASINLNTATTNDFLIGMRGIYSDSDLHIYSYGTTTDVMVIKRADGNVGIGTTDPQYKLDVHGSTLLGNSITDTHIMSGSLVVYDNP